MAWLLAPGEMLINVNLALQGDSLDSKFSLPLAFFTVVAAFLLSLASLASLSKSPEIDESEFNSSRAG
jgi:hypothetical protein